MKALPQQIKIGPVVYDVLEEIRVANDGYAGQIRYGEQTILVQPDLKPTLRAITVWHEVLHGILSQAGDREHDERVIDALAHGIVAVLADNPELVK